MIFIHLLLGIILGLTFGNVFMFILGSILPDIDHVYIMLKNKLWKPRKFIDSIKFEKKYNIKYKTVFFHSILGLATFSLIISLFSKNWILFSIAYLIHLLVDWLDIDEKYYLYPLKIKFKGFLPIWSTLEKVVTLMLLLGIIFMMFLI